MFRSTSGTVCSNQRNILVLGSTGVGKTPFIKYFEAFCFYNATQSLEHFKKLKSPFQSTKEITHNYVNALDEQLCFIDTPGSTTIQTINNIKIHVSGFNSIDAIIIILNEDLDYLKFYISNILEELNNFPSENIIFVTLHDEDSNLNELVTLVNLRRILKESRSNITVSLNRNLYLLELNIFNYLLEGNCLQESANFCRNFGAYMKGLFGGQQFVIRFITSKESLKHVIETLFLLLIDLLHCIEDNLQTLQAHTRDYNYNTTTVKYLHTAGTFSYMICKMCSSKEYPVVCHDICECVDPTNTNEIHGCSAFNRDRNACRECGCKIEDHTSTRYYAFTKPLSVHGLKKKLSFEKNTVIYLLATLYMFCQKNFNGLPKACSNFKNISWSPGKLGEVNSEDPIYKELDENIKQSTHCPSREEMAVYVRDFTAQNFHCFALHLDFVEKFLRPEFQLRMKISGRQGESQAGPSKAPEGNATLRRFPEMSTAAPPNASNKPNKKESLEDSVAMLKVLQELRNAMVEMKESIEKLQGDQANLKAQIDRINVKLGL